MDMGRAISFYESFFEQKVTVKDSIYSVFDIKGFIFNQKLEGLKVVFPATKIANNWVAEFEDSEGNHIELTTPIL